MAMELVEHIEVGAGGASSIEFTSIPQDGVDLMLLVSARHNATNDNAGKLYFNSDTTDSNYSEIWLRGTGSSSNSYSYSAPYAGYSNNSGTTSNTFSNTQIYISNYSGSATKSFSTENVTENNSSAAYQLLIAGSWSGTNAITSVTYQLTSGLTLVQYSTASLYKIS